MKVVFRRVGVLVVLLLLCMVPVFAQEAETETVSEEESVETEESAELSESASTDRKNAVSLNLFPMFKGFVIAENMDEFEFGIFALDLDYERLIVPHFSLGLGIDAYFGKVEIKPLDENMDLVYFSMKATTRFYPLSESADKFFLGASIGFNLLSYDGDTDRDDSGGAGFVGFTAALEAGYRLILTKGFFVEPSITYVLSKAPITPAGYEMFSDVTPSELEGGLSIGFAF